jgi:helicase
MAEIGKLFKIPKIREVLKLRVRVKHGIKEELLPLITLRGIGRARARRLFARGYRTLGDIRKADVKELSRVEMIGEKLAKSIKSQLEGKEEKVGIERQSRLADF